MSPILVRPVREQLEHDRVIRLLQAKYKRKFEVGANPGNEQTSPVGTGASAWFPDVVLYAANRKLAGVVEVETTESVNNLEAMSQWAAFTRFGVPFHLYLPTGSIDTARRFCADLGLQVAEIWAYQSVGEQVRFTLVHRTAQAAEPAARSTEAPPEARPRAAATTSRRRVVEPARPATRPSRPAAASAASSRPNGKAASRPSRTATAAAGRRASGGKAVKTAARRPAVKTARKAAKPARTARAAKRR